MFENSTTVEDFYLRVSMIDGDKMGKADDTLIFIDEIQREIHDYYAANASKYDAQRKLKIRRIYEQIPSNLANKKKRVVAQRIEGKKGSTFALPIMKTSLHT